MPSRNTTIQLRTITIFGAGAALLAVFGYLLLKSDSRKKTKKKSTINETSGCLLNAPSSSIIELPSVQIPQEDESDNNNNITNTIDKSEIILDCDVKLANSLIINEDSSNNNNNNNLIINKEEMNNKNSKLSETDKNSEISSDSGNGESETHIGNSMDESANDSAIIKSDTMSSITQLNQSIPQSISSISISSTTTQYNDTDLIVYEFQFPRKYCGKLIGRNGVHVDYIRDKTHVQIAVRDDLELTDLQIVSVSGCICDVDQALEIISARFPARQYPLVSFKPISKPIIYKRSAIPVQTPTSPQAKTFVSSTMFVQLPYTPNKNYQIDIHVSAIVNSTHVFIQLPFNQTYAHLQRLDEDMLHLYSNNDEMIPNLACPLEYGSICAAPTSYGWHRAMITNYYTKEELKFNESLSLYYDDCDGDVATVKFLDYGGYLNIPTSQLNN